MAQNYINKLFEIIVKYALRHPWLRAREITAHNRTVYASLPLAAKAPKTAVGLRFLRGFSPPQFRRAAKPS
jgi:hypothetical protein